MELEFESVLIFAPHPDDAEFTFGGSMARWADEGKEVRVVIVTNGAAGSNDPAVARDDLIATREREQRRASEILGVKEVIFLGYEDGYVEDSHELRRDMIREIRRHKPDLLVGLDPSTYYFDNRYVNHPDHRNVGLAFAAAVNPGATTVPLYREELYDKGFEPHQAKGALMGFASSPDYFVDIEKYLALKVEALRAHESQLGHMEGLEDFVRSMAEETAKQSEGASRYAEAFKAFSFDHKMD